MREAAEAILYARSMPWNISWAYLASRAQGRCGRRQAAWAWMRIVAERIQVERT